MARIIAIDLGTSRTRLAVMEAGAPRIIETAEGTRATPSVVALLESGERLAGEPARQKGATLPARTFAGVKRIMGRRSKDPAVVTALRSVPYKIVSASNGDAFVSGGPANYAPAQIAAFILQKMKQRAEAVLGETVERAVITVPASFGQAQRQATRDAGAIAGLDVLRIINEPTAAALAYGVQTKFAGTLVVYDLGGGTFDVSVLAIGDGAYEVTSTKGDPLLGGEDFDTRLVDFLAERFRTEQGIDLRNDKLALQRLREAAEKAKIELSSATQTEIRLPAITTDASGPRTLAVKLTRAQFEALVDDLIQRTLDLTRLALKDAGQGVGDVDAVLLVGGMTRMPKVKDAVKQLFGKEPKTGVDPDEVVALGAALQAGVLQGEVEDVMLLDVTTASLGVETLGGVMTRFIERNTTIPNRKSEVFSTAVDNQPSISVKVFQGERELTADNTLVGEFELFGLPSAPRGVPQLEVIFDIDADGILQVAAKEKWSGEEQKVRVLGACGLSREDISRMTTDAQAHPCR